MNVPGDGTSARTAADGPVCRNAAQEGDPDDTTVLEVLRRAALAGATAAQIGAATNLAQERLNVLLGGLVADGRTIVISKPHAYLDSKAGTDVLQCVLERLEQRQFERPWLMGLTSLALAQALSVPEATLVRVLAAYVDAGALAHRGGYYATPGFTPRLAADQRAFFDAVFGAQTDPRPPVPVDRLRALMKASSSPELAPALETLLAGGALTKIGAYLYRSSHIRAIRARLETALRQSGQISVAQFRDLTGSSRKYAVPLLEFFDATGVTTRRGDVRVLGQTSTPKRL